MNGLIVDLLVVHGLIVNRLIVNGLVVNRLVVRLVVNGLIMNGLIMNRLVVIVDWLVLHVLVLVFWEVLVRGLLDYIEQQVICQILDHVEIINEDVL